jgi:hypothetical protein
VFLIRIGSGSALDKIVHYTVKKALGFSVPSRDVTNQTLNKLVIPGQGEFGLVTSLLGTGKSLTFYLQYLHKWKKYRNFMFKELLMQPERPL